MNGSCPNIYKQLNHLLPLFTPSIMKALLHFSLNFGHRTKRNKKVRFERRKPIIHLFLYTYKYKV